MKPVLSIVMVNYLSEDALEHCLRSIHIATERQVEIILVDNSPGRGAEKILDGSGLEGKYLPQTSNLGYTVAANIGAGHTSGQWLCFLNPDMILTKRALDVMIDWLEQHPNTVVGPRERDSHGRITTTAFPLVTRRYIWGANLIYKLPWPEHWRSGFSWLMPSWRYGRQCQTAQHPFAAEVLSGSCLVLSQAVWKSVGPWHEELVYFGLESEWFERARHLGVASWYLPAAEVFHEHGLSIRRSDGSVVRNIADQNRQWHAWRLGWWVAAILVVLIWIERRIRPARP